MVYGVSSFLTMGTHYGYYDIERKPSIIRTGCTYAYLGRHNLYIFIIWIFGGHYQAQTIYVLHVYMHRFFRW